MKKKIDRTGKRNKVHKKQLSKKNNGDENKKRG